MHVFDIFTASDMKPCMGQKADLCPQTFDSSEGHRVSYLLVFWEAKPRLADGGTKMSAEDGSLCQQSIEIP